MKNEYTVQSEKEHTARAMALNLPISTKHSVEICSHIRNKTLEKAKAILNNSINEKIPIPFKRYKNNVGHRKGNIAAGRYPKKASEYILTLLHQVETNAQDKGLNTDDLIITNIKADKGSRIWHRGRQGRQRMKRTHVEIIVQERELKEEREVKKEKVKENKK